MGGDGVSTGGDLEVPIFDLDVPEGGVILFIGFQPIPERGNDNVPVLNDQVILAADAVIHRVDCDRSPGDEQTILAGNAILVIGVHGQFPAAVDGQIRLAEQGSIGFIFLNIDVCVG